MGGVVLSVVTPEGNLLEPYRTSGISALHNIRGTDRWLYMYRATQVETIHLEFTTEQLRNLAVHIQTCKSSERQMQIQ